VCEHNAVRARKAPCLSNGAAGCPKRAKRHRRCGECGSVCRGSSLKPGGEGDPYVGYTDSEQKHETGDGQQ
jgi:hypothetical protein